jgi:hypothetical protein
VVPTSATMRCGPGSDGALVLAGVPVLILGVLLTMTLFRDGYPWQPTTRITRGSFAGIAADPAAAARIEATMAAASGGSSRTTASRWTALPGTTCCSRPIRSPTLCGWATSGRRTRTTSSAPAVRLTSCSSWGAGEAGALDAMAERDPLIAFVVANYVVADDDGMSIVLRRR